MKKSQQAAGAAEPTTEQTAEHAAALEREILADSRQKADRTVAKAKEERGKLFDSHREKARREREKRLEEARRISQRKARAIQGMTGHEIRTQWLKWREVLVQKALQEALNAADAGRGMDRKPSLLALAAESIRELGAGDFVVRVRPAEAALVPEQELQTLAQSVLGSGWKGRVQVTPDSSLGGGLVVETMDGRRRHDNTYARRLWRLRSELRRRTAEALGVWGEKAIVSVEGLEP